MNEQEVVSFLTKWCFTIRSQTARQFIYGIEYIGEIQCCYPLDSSESVYLIPPHAGNQELVDKLCSENGLLRISEERSRSFLAAFRQRYNSVWDQLIESIVL